jgi:signal peptidase II
MLKKIYASGLLWLWIAAMVVLMDRYSKFWIVDHLAPFEPLKILPIFNLTLAFNKGAAFGFLHSASGWQNLLLCTFACLVSLIIIYWLYQSARNERWLNIALCFIIGGALGNVWDRVLYGYVIDFFDFHMGHWHFAIFNVADSAICLGAVMLIWHWIKPNPE